MTYSSVTWHMHQRLRLTATYNCGVEVQACHDSHCNTLQHSATLKHSTTRCNTLQHRTVAWRCRRWCCHATNCNTLQHAATRCNTLQHAATHCNTLQHRTVARRLRVECHAERLRACVAREFRCTCRPMSSCPIRQRCVAACCSVLQRVAVCCSVLQCGSV